MTTTPSLDEGIEKAVDEIRKQFAGHQIQVTDEGGGNVVVIIDDVHVGDQYTPNTTWLGFRITAAYPSADIYPHFIGRVTRCDGTCHRDGFQQVSWMGRPALQISRRSNGWNPRRDNAALKAAKVLAWLTVQ